jgi:hypothetical protein
MTRHSYSLRQGSERSTCLGLGAFSLAALGSLGQHGLRVGGLETDLFEGSVLLRLIPAFGLFDTFKCHDHQPGGMPIPFQGFNRSTRGIGFFPQSVQWWLRLPLGGISESPLDRSRVLRRSYRRSCCAPPLVFPPLLKGEQLRAVFVLIHKNRQWREFLTSSSLILVEGASVRNSAINSVRGRLVRNGSAASGQRESQEGRSHAPST